MVCITRLMSACEMSVDLSHRDISQTAAAIVDHHDRWRAAFVLLPGISSPTRGGFPPRRFMSLSKVLKSARALRSAKNSAVCKAESFAAHAVATHWFMLVLSSLLCRSTALFNERGNRRGDVIVSVIISSC